LEVQAIGDLISGSEVHTGARVSEPGVRRMSDRGLLRNYKVLHFATHGLVVPEVPELSAIVLSQFAQQDSIYDGYLTMAEISSLDLKADFVNLSACETGLGKIYAGEGMVGLTQAFLVAGANGLSVSLWQVSDESTMRFMTGLYALVDRDTTSYSRALTEMKRQFIEEGEYASPFYWAPFVYYGR
ncbi:MAG: CHAT domain-containing protein, partial [Spirochaetales bacterium]|nr:CHAT domain-containing protein [Spirochaetales bacterium]